MPIWSDAARVSSRRIPASRKPISVARSLHLAGERLRQSALERAVLLDRTMIAQEAERKRIARELHDSLGQYLTALRLGFNAIDPFCAANETAQQRLNQLKKLAGDLGRELNRMAWELRPMALDDLGLRRAVIQYLEEWAERSRLQIDMEIGGLDNRRLPQAVETALFRVLQEAVTNVVKHSGASRVSVVLEATHGGVWLTVEDDGRGFDIDSGTDGGISAFGNSACSACVSVLRWLEAAWTLSCPRRAARRSTSAYPS